MDLYREHSRIRWFVLLSLLLVFSCKRKNQPAPVSHPVPYVPVELIIYPNDPLYYNVQFVGGWMYINGGINGLVLYRKSDEEFVAVERTSSHLPDDPAAKVHVQSDNFTLKDTMSGSAWRMFDGVVTKGPAAWPLRLYGTSYNGNRLLIRN